MRIVEFIHDFDHLTIPSNLDLWLAAEHIGSTRKIRVYEDEKLPDFSEYDLLILHGGVQHLYDMKSDPWLANEIDYVKKALQIGKPTVGFCLGSQIIAKALGAKVFKAQTGETGFYSIQTKNQAHPLLKGLHESFPSFEWHADHYTLPHGFVSLAFTAAAQNQIIADRAHKAVGFQFHPEYTKEIIRQYVAMLPDSKWSDENGTFCTSDFIKKLNDRPDTYALFKQLLENAVEYFKIS